MITTANDALFSIFPTDYAYLRFLAKCIHPRAVAIGVRNETLN